MSMYTNKQMIAAAKKINKDSARLLHITRIKTEEAGKSSPSNDYYYIINGYYMLKIHAALYREVFRPAAPAFIELEPGEAATRNNSITAIPGKVPEPIKVLDIIPKDRGEKLTDTGYMRPDEKNNMHIFDAKTFKAAFNHNYIEMLKPFMQGDLYANSAITPAQCEGMKSNEALSGVLILPIRVAEDMQYQVVRADETGTKTEREARKAAKEEAAAIIEEAKKEAAAILEKTQEEAAAAAAEMIRQNNDGRDIEKEGDLLIKEAQEAAADVLQDAKKQAAAILAEAKREAAKIAEETDHARAIYGGPEAAKKATIYTLKKAEAEAAEIVKKARAEAVATLKAAEEERARIIAGERDAAPEEVKQEPQKARLVRNEEKHGIELYFEEVPRASVRNTLKAGGYKWHVTKQCWYSKQSEKAEKIAAALIG